MVRIPLPAAESKATCRVGPNQVLSSFGSSFSSICLRMAGQISVIYEAGFPQDFHSCGSSCFSPGPGSIYSFNAQVSGFGRARGFLP